MAIEITEEELNSLTQAILKRYGVDFTCYEPKSFSRRVARCISVFKMNSMHELWVKLLQDRSFIHNFMNEISVGLTSMFRDPILWKAMRDKILKDLSGKSEINIWHAGCSSGEEVYTMAVVLEEARVLNKAKALATDINLNAIEEAKNGKYHKIKMAEYTENYNKYKTFGSFERYYKKADENYDGFDSRLIKHVTFNFHNLITQDMDQKFDIIFCRNVMIYFDNIAKAKLLKKFHNALNPDGFFIIGFYDTISSLIDRNYFDYYDQDAKIFKKLEEVSVLK